MSNHTPGPWAVYPQPITGIEQAKEELATLVAGTPNPVGTLFMIAAPNGLAPAVTGCGKDSEANAQLIAAAPELLEALRELLRMNEESAGATMATIENKKDFEQFLLECERQVQEARAKAHAAIAKATGDAA